MLGALWIIASASSGAFSLEWSAPELCPQRDEVLAQIEASLGAKLPADAPALAASGTVTRQDDGLFHLVLDTFSGRREVDAARCDELAQAAAIVLALLLEPVAFVKPAPAAKAPPVVATAPAAAAPEAVLTVHLRAAAVGDVGTLPQASPGWHATAAFERRSLRVELFGGTFAAQRVVSGGRSATLSLDFEGGARPCWSFDGGRVRPLACLAVSVGRVSGSGAGVINAGSGSNLFAAVFAGLGLRVALGWRLALTAQLELGAPLSRTAFSFSDASPLYTTPWFLGRGELGLEAQVW